MRFMAHCTCEAEIEIEDGPEGTVLDIMQRFLAQHAIPCGLLAPSQTAPKGNSGDRAST